MSTSQSLSIWEEQSVRDRQRLSLTAQKSVYQFITNRNAMNKQYNDVGL